MRERLHEESEEVWEDDADEAEAPRRPIRHRPVRIQILHEDDDLIFVDKPAGLPTGVDESGPETVLDQLADRTALQNITVDIVEHLPTGASGVLLAARSALARREIPRQFGREEIEKTYLAIVRGAPLESEGEINIEIGPDKGGLARMRVGGSHARPALTRWRMKDRFAGFALLECRTRRERIDQVRLHLQAAGMPLAVDPEYGGAPALMLSSFKPEYRPSRRHEERPLIGRISLHAAALELDHPRDGAHLRIECAPPKDFRATLNQLDKHGRIGIPPKST